MIGYTISSILWAVGGLVVGFILGRSGQRTATENESAEMSAELPAGRFRDALTFDRIIGWVVVILAVASVVTASYTVNRQQQAVTCQTDYNQAFVAAFKERSEAAAADRQAQRELLTGMFTSRDPATGRALIEAYLRKLDAADNQRDDNPLPQRPSC